MSLEGCLEVQGRSRGAQTAAGQQDELSGSIGRPKGGSACPQFLDDEETDALILSGRRSSRRTS